MKIKEFFDKEIKEFSIYNCQRAIPSAYDGFKISQRKAIFGMLERGENAPSLRVSQATSHCANVSVYHHGEGSMAGAIIGMAQNFTGSNNLNWFTPEGQFGNRLSPASASTRYIYTKLDENFRKIFLKEDDIILVQKEDEGDLVEPEYYIPLLPGCLLNGSEGMGTGYATKILAYNPIDLIKNIEEILKGFDIPEFLIPWYKGFKGKIERNQNQAIFYGDFEIINSNTIRVFELPIGTYQESYRQHLNKLMETKISRDQNNVWVKDYDDNSTEEGFEFILYVPREVTKMDRLKLLNVLGLVSKESENYTLWVENNKIRVYSNIRAIIQDFVEWRLNRYENRRLKKIEILDKEIFKMSERVRFIESYINNNWSVQFSKMKKEDILFLLSKHNFQDFEDLLSIKIYNLTQEEIEKLNKKLNNLKLEKDKLENTTPKEMYLSELEELKKKLNE